MLLLSAQEEDMVEVKRKMTTYKVDMNEPNNESEVETLDPRDESELVKGQVMEAT